MPLRDFLVQLNIVQASSMRIEPGSRMDRIRVTLDGVPHDDVVPRRPFPISIPEFIIFVQTQPPAQATAGDATAAAAAGKEKGGGGEPQSQEICMLKDYRELDERSRLNLEGVLEKLYFIPLVLKVERLETSGDEFEWEIMTDRGERVFHTRSRRQVINMGTRIVVIDTHDNIYHIEDVGKLDGRSRMLLETVA